MTQPRWLSREPAAGLLSRGITRLDLTAHRTGALVPSEDLQSAVTHLSVNTENCVIERFNNQVKVV